MARVAPDAQCDAPALSGQLISRQETPAPQNESAPALSARNAASENGAAASRFVFILGWPRQGREWDKSKILEEWIS
jgi:hypothetical protein